MFCPYEVVTISLNRTGNAVACVQLVEDDVVVLSVVDVVAAVEVADEVVVVEQAELQIEQAEEASI